MIYKIKISNTDTSLKYTAKLYKPLQQQQNAMIYRKIACPKADQKVSSKNKYGK